MLFLLLPQPLFPIHLFTLPELVWICLIHNFLIYKEFNLCYVVLSWHPTQNFKVLTNNWEGRRIKDPLSL